MAFVIWPLRPAVPVLLMPATDWKAATPLPAGAPNPGPRRRSEAPAEAVTEATVSPACKPLAGLSVMMPAPGPAVKTPMVSEERP